MDKIWKLLAPSSNKRQRLDGPSPTNYGSVFAPLPFWVELASINALSDDIMSRIFLHIPSCFVYLALVSRRFKQIYCQAHGHGVTTTSLRAVVESSNRISFWEKEVHLTLNSRDREGCLSSMKQLKLLLKAASVVGNVGTLSHIFNLMMSIEGSIINTRTWFENRENLIAAAAKGHLNVIKWYKARAPSLMLWKAFLSNGAGYDILTRAADKGQWKTFKSVSYEFCYPGPSLDCPSDRRLVPITGLVLAKAETKFKKWWLRMVPEIDLHQHIAEVEDASLLDWIAKKGVLRTIVMRRKNRVRVPVGDESWDAASRSIGYECLIEALANGSIKVCNWALNFIALYSDCGVSRKEIVERAVEASWECHTRRELDLFSLASSPRAGVASIQWLVKIGFVLHPDNYEQAASQCNISLLRYFSSLGLAKNERSVISSGSNIECRSTVMEWAVDEEGFELSEWMCRCAIRDGNMPLLQWLRKRGCPWGANTLRDALRERLDTPSHHPRAYVILNIGDCVKWATQNGCTMPVWSDEESDEMRQQLLPEMTEIFDTNVEDLEDLGD